jgi:N-acetylmuramoyl-L-alanine amidase
MLKKFSKLILTLCLAAAFYSHAYAEAFIDSTRVWSAQDYTRLTLESAKLVRYRQFTLNNPQRLVIDLHDVSMNAALKSLASKISSDDPYIRSVRVGLFKPDTVRLVLDLKTEVKPQLFNLKPVGEYGHRLVLDIYPEHPVDPLVALLQSLEEKSAVATVQPPIDTITNGNVASQAIPPLTSQTRNSINASARILIIAIDAGHGGEDPGAKGYRGTLEKNITLAIARKLKKLMEQMPDMRGVLIRDGDYFIPLGGRIQKARQVRADLFISIHADAFTRSSVRGSSVFTLSEGGASSASASWLAKKENEADLIGGVNLAVQDPHLAHTLLDLSQTASINDSVKLAKHVLGELSHINTLHGKAVGQAGFAVLKAPDIPSILVETAFISNPTEERRLNDPAYQEDMAQAILKGIKRYFAQSPALSRPTLSSNN